MEVLTFTYIAMIMVNVIKGLSYIRGETDPPAQKAEGEVCLLLYLLPYHLIQQLICSIEIGSKTYKGL